MYDKKAVVQIQTVLDDKGLADLRKSSASAAKTTEALGQATGTAAKKTKDLAHAARMHNQNIRAMQKSMRGLALEIPILSRLTEVVFHPFGAAVVAGIAALNIFRNKLKDTRMEFVKHEGFDIAPKVDAAAQAWERYAAAVTTASGAMKGLDERMKQIETKFKRLEQLGLEGLDADKAKAREQAAEKARTAANMGLAAQTLGQQADSIKVVDEFRDRSISKKLADDAAKANTDLEAKKKQIDDVERFGVLSPKSKFDAPTMAFRDPFRAGQYLWAMGKHLLKWGVSEPANVQKMLEGERGELEGTIAQSRAWDAGAATRASQRASQQELRKRAAEYSTAQFDTSTGAREQWDAAQRDYAYGRFTSGQPVYPSVQGGGATVSVEAANELRKVIALSQKLQGLYMSWGTDLEQKVNAMQARQSNR